MEIDLIEERLPQLTQFILPTGHHISSLCHIARTVCRRQKEELFFLSYKTKKYENTIQFLNRLSDYLFVLARVILIRKQ